MRRSGLPPNVTHVKAARVLRGLSQREAAHLAGMSQSHYGAIERAESQPSLPLARAIARGLGVSIDELWPALSRTTEAA